ncbi:MAG: cobalamin B12-binding domain-containing protein [Candidatus Abyssubacteria bacterium]|nr:cobalamin B12-binding domain-containing protein [Candidatus Abyssubacteria bacterium]
MRGNPSAVDRKIRILLAKPGLDGHNIGIRLIARALRDEGFEVIYGGMLLSPEQVAQAAMQEDVDAIGLSILSGAHMGLMEQIMSMLKENGAEHIPVFLGGVIPDKDIPRLYEMGVAGVYLPDTPIAGIVESIRQYLLDKTTQ